MKFRYPRRILAGRWCAYAILLGMIATSAFLPAVLRDVPLLGVFGLLGVVVAGVHFATYYSVHGTAWKGRHQGVAVPVVLVVATICIFPSVQDAFGGWFNDETVPHLVVAAGEVVAGVAGAVLGANIGWRYKASDKPKRRILTKEAILLVAIFTASLAVVYAECAETELFWSGNLISQYAAQSLVAVAGALLGVNYSSYKARYGGQLWYGATGVALLAVTVSLTALFFSDAQVCTNGIIWPIMVALISVPLEICRVVLGTYYSARLKKRDSVD